MRPKNKNVLTRGPAVALFLCLIAAPASAQSGDRRPDDFQLNRGDAAREQTGQATPEARDQLRQRLRNRLDDVRTSEERLEEALRMLDAGEPVEAVRRHVIVDGAAQGPHGRHGQTPGRRMVIRGGAEPHALSPEVIQDLMRVLRGVNEGDRVGAVDPKEIHALMRALHEAHGGGQADAADMEEIHDLMRVLHETNPQLHVRIRTMMEHDPEAGHHALERFAPRLQHLIATRENDPEAFQERREELIAARGAMELAREIRTGIEEGMAPERLREARDELRTLIDRQFELRMQRTSRHVDEMRRRLERLETEMQTQQERRNQLVEERVNNIIRGAVEGRPERLIRPDGARPGDRDGAQPGEGLRLRKGERPDNRRGAGRDRGGDR